MVIKHVIDIVNKKLFDSFSQLDLWFSESQHVLNYVPIDSGWTGIQILEHVMLTSHYLLILIDKGTRKSLKRAELFSIEENSIQYTLSSEALDQIAKSNSFVWIRPEHMEPVGNILDSEIREQLSEQHDRCLQYLDKLKNGEGVLCLTTMSVNSLGKLDVYQYLYFLALHIDRHIEQLNRNKNEFLKTE